MRCTFNLFFVCRFLRVTFLLPVPNLIEERHTA